MDARIDKILHEMSLEEKIALCSGANFWQTKAMPAHGIPDMFLCDGPHGLRKQERASGSDMLGVNESRPSTCFPTSVTGAASWDALLMEQIGMAIGEEASAYGVDVVLGPGVNIKRDPLCGRNFEYLSEDPYLAGKLAASFIKGVQKNGTGASLKHFAFNNQELSRFNSDSVMDARTMREIYLPAFETAVKESRPATVMCAYNKLSGVHCSDSVMLLTDILREEWGFDGAVITDWGAMNDRIEGFRAGCDLNMPGGSAYMEKEVLQAVRDGSLTENAVNESARRIIKLALHAGEVRRPDASFDEDTHHNLAVHAACQGAVLLKNEDGILPLREGQRVALIGPMAKKPRFQGAGSSHINPLRMTAAADFMPHVSYIEGCDALGETNDTLLREAVEAAKAADIAVVFAGLPDRYESEGFDRDDMRMPEGYGRLIKAISAANPNTVVVLLCGSVVQCPWADGVKAILYMGLPGQGGGEAAARLLNGRANPCGKLAETWPLRYEDCPTSGHYKGRKDAQYREGVYVGYRYYDKAAVPVRWPFGYGLSYTRFQYSDLQVDGDKVTAVVTNTGDVAGAEIVQLYIAPPAGGLHRPAKELKGFSKLFLLPGESKSVEFMLNARSFAVWDGVWKTPGGAYVVMVGSSSADLPLTAVVEKDGGGIPAPAWQAGSWYETLSGHPSQAEWEAMLGRKFVDSPPEKGRFTMDNSVEEMKEHSLVMRIMYKAVEATIAKGFGGKKDYTNPAFRMMMASSAGSPLRSMQISGGIKDGLFHGLLDMANGHFFRGLLKMMRG